MADTTKKVQQAKVDAVTALRDTFKEARDYIFTDYRGLTVEQITNLRRQLREKSADYKVVKNRFAKIALKDLEEPDVDEYLAGPTAVALAREESGPVAKVLVDFGKEMPVAVKGGIIDGRVMTGEELEAYSRLPSRDELYAMLMGTMQAPVQNLAYALNGVVTKLVRTLQAVADARAEAS